MVKCIQKGATRRFDKVDRVPLESIDVRIWAVYQYKEPKSLQ